MTLGAVGPTGIKRKGYNIKSSQEEPGAILQNKRGKSSIY